MNIFKLANLNYFYVIPLFLLGIFFIYRIYIKNLGFNSSALSKMRNYKYSKLLFSVRMMLLLISFLFLFVSVLRPAWGTDRKTVEAKGIDVVFTLDVSQSMKALDIGKGLVDRLTLAKNMIAQFASTHPSNRYGLVIFAGEAFVSSPLTTDTSAFLTFLDGVSYNDVGKQGTDINAALRASIDRFYSEQDKKRGRSLVIISDGGEDANGDISAFAKVAGDLNIKIFTIGIGSTDGVPIPEGRDVFGHVSYKKYQGKIVTSKLNEKILKQIADETGGEYFHAKKNGDLEKIADKLSSLETSLIKTEENAGLEDRYQYFLLPSFLFFLFYIFLEFADELFFSLKQRLGTYKKYLKISSFVILAVFLTGCTNSNISFRYYNTKGNDNYKKNYYKEAKEDYAKAGESSHELKYISDNNSAVVGYTEKDYLGIAKKMEDAIFIYCEKQKQEYCGILYYNLGNIYYRLGEEKADSEQADFWQKAIEVYKKDLEINQTDDEAQENIDFIMQKLKEKNDAEKSGDNNRENSKQDNSSDVGSDEGENSQDASSEEQSKEGDSSSGEEEKTQSQNDQTGNNKEDNKQDQTDIQSDESRSENDSSSDSGGQDNKATTALDEKTAKQVENYMKALEKQEKNNQDYFQPNPNGSYESNSPFDDFFDDSFFKDFFDNKPFGGSFNNNEKTDGIDW